MGRIEESNALKTAGWQDVQRTSHVAEEPAAGESEKVAG